MSTVGALESPSILPRSFGDFPLILETSSILPQYAFGHFSLILETSSFLRHSFGHIPLIDSLGGSQVFPGLFSHVNEMRVK